MKLSKKQRRSLERCIEDALYQVDQLWKGFLKQSDATRLDCIELLLYKMGTKIGGKRWKVRTLTKFSTD